MQDTYFHMLLHLDRNKPRIYITMSPVTLDIKSHVHIVMLHFDMQGAEICHHTLTR